MDERDEEEAEFVTNAANWPDQTDTQAWLKFSVRALRAELACCLDHLEDRSAAEDDAEERELQDYKFAKHMETIVTGIAETRRVHFEALPQGLQIELTRELLEEQNGVPVSVVELGGRIAFVPEQVVVPDNLDGLDGSQNE